MGHVDSGKSTLSGRLLHLLGKISKRDMHKNEKEAKEKVSCYCFVSATLLHFDSPLIYNCLCAVILVSRERGHLLMHGPWMRALKKEKEVSR